MNNDKIREEFEAWAKGNYSHFMSPIARNAAGEYKASPVRRDWSVWQASRESMVAPKFCGYKFEGCQYYDADSVDEALEDLGLKVKP